MEPEIRFCTSVDGTRISFETYGDKGSSPLVYVDGWSTNFEVNWERSEQRRWWEQASERRYLVSFDRRGTGGSEREVTDLSLEAHVADVGAIAEALRLTRFALMGGADGCAVACAYAAQNPQRVSRLLLWSPYARGEDIVPHEAIQGLVNLIHGNWSLARSALADIVHPSGPISRQQWYSDYLRRAVTPEVAARYVEFHGTVDVTAFLPQIQTPTLILHRRGSRNVPIKAGRAVASLIPDARLIGLDGDSTDVACDDTSYLADLSEFLDEESEQTLAPAAAPSGLVTILFTDMESSTALTQRLGDAKAQELVRTHNTIVRDSLKDHGGSEIKHTGDGIMASFLSASGALECAVAIQRSVEAQGVGAHGRASLRVRIGLNAGEPVAEEDDLFGASVQLARRVCDHAEPGQVVVADVVRQLATGKGFLFSDLGDVVPKGFEEPVRLYEVRWREEG